jgi:BirA family biotin operon repressor/biotin-[acetyl-CoA-carboxylase] ligase
MLVASPLQEVAGDQRLLMESEISREAIAQGLTTRFVGRQILYFETVPSTMDAARKAAKDGASEGTVVVAEEQTGGKGRLKRSWISPPGVAAVSIILRPEMPQLIRLTIVASLATSRAIEQATGLETTIKWPNDVLIRGKKVSGILSESALRRGSVDWAIIGIGINVNFDPGAYPEIAGTATSLSSELGREVSQVGVLQHLLTEIETLYSALRSGTPIHEEWASRLETLGKNVRVTSGRHVEEGYAESVDSDGSLLLRRPDGSLAQIVAGDVTLRQ